MAELRPTLRTTDEQLVYHASEELHRRKTEFSHKPVLLAVVIRYADALDYEAEGDHIHAAESFSAAAAIIMRIDGPTSKNMRWATELVDSARINLDKHAALLKPQEPGDAELRVEMEMLSTQHRIDELRKKDDLPKPRPF